LNSTGELQKLIIIKTKNRSKKKEYEFEFVCHDGAAEYLARQAAALEKLNSSKSKVKSNNSTADGNNTDAPKANNSATKQTTTINPLYVSEIAAAKASPMFSQWTAGTPTSSCKTAAEHINSIIIPQFANALNPGNLTSLGINDLNELHQALCNPSSTCHKKLSEALLSRLDRRLTMYGNECYTEGFNAGKSIK
jgi:hypothetical protein